MTVAPQFSNLLRVLQRQAPTRPTLFEFFLNLRLCMTLAREDVAPATDIAQGHLLIRAFADAGYDYATLLGSDFGFPCKPIEHTRTFSLNARAVIHDRASFDAYVWPDPDAFDYSKLVRLADNLPDGMKLIVWGSGGVLENVIALVGYEQLCILLYDDPALVEDVFTEVGSRLARYYQICASFDTVGALMGNDDWGFRTQTMLTPKDLRHYVFPWHRRIVAVAHAAGKPAILHSCGNLAAVMDDIIDDLRYDGKHSYEDTIDSVEEAYERWGHRIAILGGIDMDFLCRATQAEVSSRAEAMLARTASRGGYALGSGNSIADYVPDANYFAMISTATRQRD